jgi:hypothetical protein
VVDQATALKTGFPTPTVSIAGKAKLESESNIETAFVLAALAAKIDDIRTILADHDPNDQDAMADKAVQLTHSLPSATDAALLAKAYDEAVATLEKSYPVAAKGLAVLSRRLVAIGADLHQIAIRTPTPDTYRDLENQLDGFPTAKAPDNPCAAALAYNIALDPARAKTWSFGAFEFPDSKRPSLQVEVGTKTSSDPVALPIEVWVTSIGRDIDVGVQWVAVETKTPSFSAVLAAFVQIVLTGKLPAPPTKSTNSTIAWLSESLPEVDLGPEDDTSAAAVLRKLRLLTSWGQCSRPEAPDTAYDDPLEPLATYHSTISLTAPSDNRSAYNVRVCAGPCGDAPPIGTTTVNRPVSGGFGLIGSVGWTFSNNTTHDLEFTEYNWLPTASFGGGQQVYTLRAVNKPLDGLTTTASIVYRWNRKDVDVAIGGGPALTFGGKSASLGQWTGGLFVRPHALDLFISATAGFRMVDVPTGATENMTVQGTSAPSLIKTQDREWAFTIGLGWDLTTLIGNTGSAVANLFGGK